MFQFRRFPSYAYLIQRRMTEYCSAGFPHSEISGSWPICGSPKLIAACHVLHRLLMPRHSPCALINLTSRRVLRAYGPLNVVLKNHAGFRVTWLIVFTLVSTICSTLLLAFPFWNYHFTLFSFQGARSNLLRSDFSIQLQSWVLKSALTCWWAKVDSNHRPHDYQSCALTS